VIIVSVGGLLVLFFVSCGWIFNEFRSAPIGCETNDGFVIQEEPTLRDQHPSEALGLSRQARI
jgi:hypothetical protein